MSYGINVNELSGKTLKSAVLIQNGRYGDTITFVTVDGDTYTMLHDQDCCEYVRVEDVSGDLNDLVGSPILMAEEVSDDAPADHNATYIDQSHTWTFYKFATINGYVTIRWLGESNGYYSESVSFYKEEKQTETLAN